MIYFIRHGETDWNVAGKCQGRRDIPLNARGIVQARAVRLPDQVDACFCSPLLRMRQTFAEIFGREPTPAELDDRLVERNFGEYEGVPKDDFDFAGFWNSHAPQQFREAESIADVEQRAQSFLDDINRRYRGKNVVVVAHGGFGLILRSLIEGKPADGNYLHASIANAAVTPMNNDAPEKVVDSGAGAQ